MRCRYASCLLFVAEALAAAPELLAGKCGWCSQAPETPEQQLFSLLQTTATVRRVAGSPAARHARVGAAPMADVQVPDAGVAALAASTEPAEVARLQASIDQQHQQQSQQAKEQVQQQAERQQPSQEQGQRQQQVMPQPQLQSDWQVKQPGQSQQLHSLESMVQLQEEPKLWQTWWQQQPQPQHRPGGSLEAAVASPSVVSLVEVRADLASASEGDLAQGFILTFACLATIIAIYLCVFNDASDDVKSSDVMRYMNKSSQNQLGGYTRGAASQLLVARPPESSRKSIGGKSAALASSKSLGGEMPRTWGNSMLATSNMGTLAPAPSLPGMAGSVNFGRPSMVGSMSNLANDWYTELPKIYPQLVIPKAYTRLALPRSCLAERDFEVDITGWSGVPLLCAARVERGGKDRIDILFHDHTVQMAILASVSPSLEIFGAEGVFVGALREKGSLQIGAADQAHLVMRDRGGRPILVLTTTRADSYGRDFKMSFAPAGFLVECATAVRRPPLEGRPAEHYEIVVNPDIDAVLVLAVLLAALVFE